MAEDQTGNTQTENAAEGASTNGGLKTGPEGLRQEVSAATIGRMMGLATLTDLKLLDSKIDLISTKLSGFTVKLDKALTMLNGVPTAADMERLDVQIGSVKTALRETIDSIKEAVGVQQAKK